MPSPLVMPSLVDALVALGNANVYYAPWPLPVVTGGWSPLGSKVEGTIDVKFNEKFSKLTAPDLTGDIPHEVTVMGAAPVVTMPLIMGNPALWPILSPTGSAHGGTDYPQATVKYGIMIIPDTEIGGGLSYAPTATPAWTRLAGNGVAGASGAGAAPINTITFWRGILYRPESLPYTRDNGGRVVTNIVFEALYDVARLSGHKIWTIGDPLAAGASFRL